MRRVMMGTSLFYVLENGSVSSVRMHNQPALQARCDLKRCERGLLILYSTLPLLAFGVCCRGYAATASNAGCFLVGHFQLIGLQKPRKSANENALERIRVDPEAARLEGDRLLDTVMDGSE